MSELSERDNWTATDAAQLREKLGVVHYRSGPDMAADVEAFVRLAESQSWERRGRGLSREEEDIARRQATAGIVGGGFQSPTLTEADYRDLGFGYTAVPEPEGKGIAVVENGKVVSGDFSMAARIAAAEAERRAALDYAGEITRQAGGVAQPS